MNIRTLTWNIGGGKLLGEGEDPGVMSSYVVDGLDAITETIKTCNPDIIAIQEAHGDAIDNQVARIARSLGYEYHFYDAVSESHIDDKYRLGNGLISRFPISDLITGRFLNPRITFDLEGRSVSTHDKGYGSCTIDVEGISLRVTSLHLIPFRSVGLDMDNVTARQILSSVSNELSIGMSGFPRLIQGDFNIHSDTVLGYLDESLETNTLQEVSVDRPTTPKGRVYDHVLYDGMKLAAMNVDASVRTDHYPVICDFEVSLGDVS